jgi:hypothetical protein
MEIVRSFESIVGQSLTQSVYNSTVLCNATPCKLINLLLNLIQLVSIDMTKFLTPTVSLHSVTVICIFKMFLPPIQTEFTKVTSIYYHFQEKVYLSIILFT